MATKQRLLLIGTTVAVAIIASLSLCGSSLRYWFVGMPLFSLPQDAFATKEAKKCVFTGTSSALSTQEQVFTWSALSTEQEQVLTNWLKRNESGWCSTLATALPGNLIIAIRTVELNFDFEQNSVTATFPISQKADVQLEHKMTAEERNDLSKTFDAN